SITPNPAFFYGGNTRGEILQALLYVVSHGEGIIKVTGEVGSGKTMLCRMLESQLPPHVEVIYLVNPSLSPLEVLFAIAGELGIDAHGKRSDEVLRALHTDLIAKHAAGQQVVLLVEEAQAMPLDTLEEIRLLTNLETARNKLLQIVLFGQPELDEHLNLPGMRQLKERITHSFDVPAMAPELVPDFLDFRMRAAGYQGQRAFEPEAARLIARASQGIVRRINILADKALLAAFAADASSVSARHAQQAIQESPYRSRLSLGYHASPARVTLALSLLIVVLLAGAVWQWLRLSAEQRHGLALASSATTAPLAAAPRPPLTLLQQSLRASRTWLRDEPAHHLSLLIETQPASAQQELDTFLQHARGAIGLTQLHAVPQRSGDQDQIAIVYGSFETLEQAQQVQTLLAERWNFRPLIRDMQDMRNDAAASHVAW
ncbi:MAG: ExeA family protein, partial [Sphingomonadaceae bacterium]